MTPELAAKLKAFKNAAFELSIAWEEEMQREDTTGQINPGLLTAHYPFNESFDETVLKIAAWVEANPAKSQP